MHVGLHDDRIEGLVDPASGLEDRGEEAALAQLRDSQLHVTGLGREQPRPVPVALGDPGVGSFVAVGPDHRGEFGLDQLLADQGDRFFDEVQAFAGTEGVKQFGQDRLIKGHRM
jgi:hypothetical protein